MWPPLLVHPPAVLSIVAPTTTAELVPKFTRDEQTSRPQKLTGCRLGHRNATKIKWRPCLWTVNNRNRIRFGDLSYGTTEGGGPESSGGPNFGHLDATAQYFTNGFALWAPFDRTHPHFRPPFRRYLFRATSPDFIRVLLKIFFHYILELAGGFALLTFRLSFTSLSDPTISNFGVTLSLYKIISEF